MNCVGGESKNENRFISQGWLETNLRHSVLGILIGISIFLMISAYSGEWMGWRTFMFQTLFSYVITIAITNSIYFSQRLVTGDRAGSLAALLIYYLACILGMFVGVELVYLILAVIFKLPYIFFHKQELAFSLCITVIICSVLYSRGLQRQRLNSSLKAKELDVLRLTQLNTQAELAALQARINPHFLYNALNAIASLIREDPNRAERMTLKLSALFRSSINQSPNNLITVSEEMELVNSYLDIEKVRFGDRIAFISEIDPAAASVLIPRFLIQPLVENALKHGLNNMTSGGWLKISVERNQFMEIAVADNGAPFPNEYEMGYGLQSTYDKLTLLYPDNFELNIRNSPVKEVRVRLPRNND